MRRHYEVLLGDSTAGLLEEGDDGRPEFRLTEAYLEEPKRPVLGQVFEANPAKVYREKADRLTRWFGNLLPEPLGRLRQFLVCFHGIEERDDLGLLGELGLDLPGALRVEPRPGGLVAHVSTRSQSTGLEKEPATPALRFSLAGIQLKFSVVASGERIALPSGNQEGRFILKVAGRQWEGLAANEAVMMLWAGAAGFDVAETRVVPLPDLQLPAEMFADAQPDALLVKRFDRTDEGRVHQEDLAQVTDTKTENKYQAKFDKLAPLVRALLGDSGFEEYLRRLTLMVAQGNADAHLKNWSLRYASPRTPAWAPLYDQVSTIAWPHVSADLALPIGGTAHLRGVTLDSLRHVARVAGYPPERAVELAAEVIDRLRSTWKDVLDQQPLPASHRAALVEHWRRAALLREFPPLEGSADH